MRRARQLKVRLYFGQDDDLLEWLDSLDPRINRGEAIKEALRRGIDNRTTSAPANATLDADAVREAVTNAIAQSLDLAEIRRVVEAAVTSALAAIRVNVVEETTGEDDDESEDFLDTLGDELLL